MPGYPTPNEPCIVCGAKTPDNTTEPRFAYVTCKRHEDVPPAYLHHATDQYKLFGLTRWDAPVDGPLTATKLLGWLSDEEYSQYGECHGKALDQLVQLGLAQVHGKNENQGAFIAKEPAHGNMMYRAVSLTEKGRAAVRALKGGTG